MLRTGIIGMGKMGRAHADWVNANESMELVAICEKNAGRADELRDRYGVAVYIDADVFLSETKPDLVVIVTTNEVHEAMTIKALEAKAHVIVEKPMSLSYESTLRMIAAAERNGRKIFVHQSSRWDRDYFLVRDAIKSGVLGDILCVQSRVMSCDEGWPSWGIEGMANPWRILPQYGGGMLFDWGPHLVDQFIQIAGRLPERIYGKLQCGVWSKDVDDYFFSLLDFGDGVVYQIECSNNAMLDMPRWFVIGTKGSVLVKGKRAPFWDDAVITYFDEYGKQRTDEVKLEGVKESGLEGGFYEDLIKYLAGENVDFVEMEQASNVVRTLELIKKSSDEGRVVGFN